MGRSLRQSAKLVPRVREARLAHGWSQAQLAKQTGLARQAISAIEAGSYVPNTLVALALARALGSTVETLFDVVAEDQPQRIRLVSSAAADERRLAVARVRGKWIGYPLRPDHEVDQGLFGASGLLLGSGGLRAGEQVDANLLVPREVAERTVLLLGCDPGLGLLAGHLSSQQPDVRLVWLSMGSEAALSALRDGVAHVAGSHLHDPDTGVYNLPYARRALAATGGLILSFACWEQGLVVGHGNPKAISGVEDLARPDVRLINRETGAGSRALLDELLQHAGVPSAHVSGYDRVARSHQAVGMTVASGGADAGIALRSTARSLDLGFVPLVEARFDLVVPSDQLELPGIQALLHLLQTRALRADVRALAGYDADNMGTVLERVPAAA